MSEELIKRLRTVARDEELEWGLGDDVAALLREAADALSRPAPAVQVPSREQLEAIAAEVVEDWRAMYSGTQADTLDCMEAACRNMLAAAPAPATVAHCAACNDTGGVMDARQGCMPCPHCDRANAPTTVATEPVAQGARKGIRLEPAELRAMMEWAGIGDGYDKDDAAPLLLWVGEMKDEEGIVTYGLNARNEEVPDEGCWLVKELPRPEVNADKPEQAEDALRSLACWLSVGGYNSEEVDAAEFEKRIREGIETIVRVEVERAKKPVAQGGGVDVEKVMALVEQYGQEKWNQGDNQYRRGCESSATYYSEEAGRIRDRLRALLTAAPAIANQEPQDGR